MNPKPLFISSLIAATIAAMALEGKALSLGQAIAVLVPACVLMVWSFMRTDWYEPAEGGEKHVDKEFTENMKAEIVAIGQIKNPHSLKMLILFHETAIQVAKNQLQAVRGLNG